MYISAGQRSSGRVSSTAAWLQPESNHTSRMSVSLRKRSPSHLPQRVPGGNSSASVRRCHSSMPRPSPKKRATCWITRSSSSSSPQPSQ